MLVLSGFVLSLPRPSGTVSCPICMDGYSEVRMHMSFLLCQRENGAEDELHSSELCGRPQRAGREVQSLDLKSNCL